jgi:hypothetical protein
MNVIIEGKDYPVRAIEGISLSDAKQGDDLTIRALAALLKLQRNIPVDHEQGIEAILAYFQFCVPSMPRDVLEGQVKSQRVSIALEVELENKLLLFGIALLEKYPELQQHHDQRMREEGLC